MSAESDFKPRNYQVALREIAIKRNTIIYLPTGSGKTYIAILVLKHFTERITKCYSQDGKISFVLVNSVPLVNQHAKCIEQRTVLKVGQYSGDMNLDCWNKEKWHEEFDKYNVFVMTVQILVNLTNQNFIDLNKVNLIIFDECHRGVDDQPMRQLCKSFINLSEQPRVVGLTATLLNGNCSPTKIMEQVKNLEITFHSQVATVDGIEQVSAFSTNPIEKIVVVLQHVNTHIENTAIHELENIIMILSCIKDITEIKKPSLIPLAKKEEFQKLSNIIKDIVFHIETTGIFGGSKAILARMIHIERLKKHCGSPKLHLELSYIGTILGYLKKLLDKHMQGFSESDKVTHFSSDKILKLIQIFDDYQMNGQEELCALIFTKRRFTAKVIFYILDHLSKHSPKYSYMKLDFIVGYNINPYNDTRELLYTVKKNRSILQSFNNKEINILVASNVLEEGIDVQSCSLVIKYDHPEEYRSYIQSKGRARNPISQYYLLVEDQFARAFEKKYQEFRAVENILQDFLIGKNTERLSPSECDINKMYHEDPIPPYYTNGPNSAKVDMTSAISLLCSYCQSLSKNIELAPELYSECDESSTEKRIRVIIDLPTVCPLNESITGPFMPNKKLAKRAAALQACIKLHQLKELDDNLLPKRRIFVESDFSNLFAHYPKEKEPLAGTNTSVREHKNEIPTFLQGPFIANNKAYLHILCLTPEFVRKSDLIGSTFYDMFISDLCYGFVTPHAVPTICSFPLYVSIGTLNVSLLVNANAITLTEDDIHKIKEFNVMVLKDVLVSLREFLICSSGCDTEAMMIVPVNKSNNTINYTLLRSTDKINPPYVELSREEKLRLNVTQESHLRKIVSPWYRDMGEFLVTEVSLTKSAKSMFPNDSFESYEEYYKNKHNLLLVNPDQPLLLVKQLTKNRNFYKPYGLGSAKRKEKHNDMEIHLIPELVVKQEFPAELWVQSSLLPSVISRLSFMFRLEAFRSKVAAEIGFGIPKVTFKKPLELNIHLLHYKPYINEPTASNVLMPISKEESLSPPLTSINLNRNYSKRMLEIEYPWKDSEEPKDIERELNVSILDIDYYEAFLSKPITSSETLLKNEISSKQNQLALTYMKDYVENPIKLLENKCSEDGPELCEIYEAMTTIKSNDIVNMERLETLGDSFLKMFASTYIYLKYPKFTESSATSLKGRLVSNKNLYYLGKLKNIGGIMKTRDLQISDWLPTGFKVPDAIENAIMSKKLSVSLLYRLTFSTETQVTGILTKEDYDNIDALKDWDDDDDDVGLMNDAAPFFNVSFIGDKRIADCVEALIGVYFKSNGIPGGIQFMEWMNIIPPSENLYKLICQPSPNPILNEKATHKDIMFHIPRCSDIENIIGYKFNNPAYLLEALTHGSYTPNRITRSYERLEFLGDAILDFLLTCYIYENSTTLNPGELTDLRSALVNNNTFASLVVRYNLHKYLLCINNKLQPMIDRFAQYMLAKNYEIDDEVLILLEEGDADGEGHNLAEYIDVPKVLGDLFEALAGAIFLDSNKNLNVVWRVFHRIMWNEIESFTSSVPKNLIRRLHEWTPDPHPKFMEWKEVKCGTVMVPLQFLLDGRTRQVYGFGSNKTMAKKAAAKLALRQLK